MFKQATPREPPCSSSLQGGRVTRVKHIRWPGLCLAVAVSIVAALLPSSAWAEDWGYRVRPGDTLWDLGTRYLKPGIGWRQLQAQNRIEDPYRLPPGQRLRIPIGWLRVEPAPARVIAVQQPAELRGTPHNRPQPLQAGTLLGAGAELRTGAGGSVTLEFADASRMQLRERSQLRLDRLTRYGHTGMVDTRLRLEQGRANNRVTPATGPASQYIIDAPTATSSVRGTRFRVSAGEAAGAATTEVLEGRVQVGNRHGHQLVPPGHASRTPDGERAPQPLVDLLPAPALGKDSRLHMLPLLLHWAPVDAARSYRVDVVRADAPDVLLFTASTPATQLVVDDLPTGDMHLLLRAVDADGVEGWDAQHTLHVSDQPPAPLTLAPLYGQRVNSSRPRFEWSVVPDASRSVLQIARDPAFADVVSEQSTDGHRLRSVHELAPGQYYWRVASRDAQGHQGRFGQALPLTVTDEPVDPGLQPPEAAAGQLTLRWQAVAEGERYRVQVDRRGDFVAPLLDELTDQPQVSFTRPWHGTLHVRVQYIADDGHAEAFSPPQQVPLPCRTCAVLGGGAALLLLLP